MKLPTPAQKPFVAAAEIFHCAYTEHYAMWMTGKMDRHGRTEKALPALVKKGYLVALPYGRKNLYTTPDRARLTTLGNTLAIHPYHGLACTDIILRLVFNDPRRTLLSERVCGAYRWGIKPECGFLLNSVATLLEFGTADNVEQGKVKQKINRYREAGDQIRFDLNAELEVLFVLDIPADKVERHVQDGPFRFMAYDTFKDDFPLP